MFDSRNGTVAAEVRIINEKSHAITTTTALWMGGSFEVSHLSPGSYTVETSYANFPKWVRTGVEVTAGSVTRVRAQFADYQQCLQGWQVHELPWWVRSTGALVIGRVMRSGQATPDATVTLTNEQSKAEIKAQTNGWGEFAFGDLAPGSYSLKIVLLGLKAPIQKQIRVLENSLTTLQVGFGRASSDGTPALQIYSRPRTPPVRMTGTAMDPSNAAVPDVEVRVTKMNSTVAVIGLGTCDGLFAVYGLDPETYRAEVRFSGFRTWSKDGLDVGKDAVNLEVVLKIGSGGGPVVMAAPAQLFPNVVPSQVKGQVKGKIVDRMASEVAGATIRLTKPETGQAMIGQSNMDGRFAFNGVAPGMYNIEIEFPGLEKCVLKAVSVMPGKSSNVDVVMGQGIPSVGEVRVGQIEW